MSSKWFEHLNSALCKENFSENLATMIPKQFYCKNYDHFINEFNLYASNYGNNLFILIDGNLIKSELQSSTNISNRLIHLLEHKYSIKLVNLSEECKSSFSKIHASEYYVSKVQSYIREQSSCDIFISLGSGTITDILKHALFLEGKKCIFISIPTAMTVTAFTSNFSVVDISGAKRTRVSQLINATFWIEPLLQAAPIQFSRAGYGDLLARFVANADWYLGYTLKISETYSDLPFRLMEGFSEKLKFIAPFIGEDVLSSETTEIMAACLAMAGIAMSVSGETTPLSGYEHVISHGLDFLRLTSHRELVLHGEQVALASLTSAVSFEWLLSIENFDLKSLRIFSEKQLESTIHKAIQNAPYWGENERNLGNKERDQLKSSIDNNLLSVQIIFYKEYLAKHEKWLAIQKQLPSILSRWPQIKEKLKLFTISSHELETILIQAKLPLVPEQTSPKTTALEYRFSMRFAPFIRSRFCIADFIFWLGEDPCMVAAI